MKLLYWLFNVEVAHYGMWIKRRELITNKSYILYDNLPDYRRMIAVIKKGMKN